MNALREIFSDSQGNLSQTRLMTMLICLVILIAYLRANFSAPAGTMVALDVESLLALLGAGGIKVAQKAVEASQRSCDA